MRSGTRETTRSGGGSGSNSGEEGDERRGRRFRNSCLELVWEYCMFMAIVFVAIVLFFIVTWCKIMFWYFTMRGERERERRAL